MYKNVEGITKNIISEFSVNVYILIFWQYEPKYDTRQNSPIFNQLDVILIVVDTVILEKILASKLRNLKQNREFHEFPQKP